MIKINNIKKIVNSYPKLAATGYSLLKNFWKIKAEFINYEYPAANINSLPFEKVKEYNRNRIFGPKMKICYAPNNNMHFQTNGDVTSCSFNKKLVIGNVNDNSLKEIWNSNNAIEIRKNMADYDLNKCHSCKMAFSYENYSSFPPTKYDLFSEDHSDYPTQMSFEISNLCNYECIMCNEDLSSSIRKSKNLPPLKNVYPDSFLEQLSEFIPHLKVATFIGGEPLLIKSYFAIWDQILKSNKDCIIHIQTNGSVLTSKFLRYLESGQFEIGVSLDALDKKVFEKIRINSKFEEVIENVNTLIQYYKKGKIGMNINFCLMNNNWEQLPKMLSYCNENNISLKIIQIDSPFNFDIKHMSYNFIVNVVNTLQSFQIKPYSNTVIEKRNIVSYNETLSSIQKFKSNALQIQDDLLKYSVFSVEELKFKLQDAFNTLAIFQHFNEKVKQDIYNYTIEHINSLTSDDNIQRRVLSRVLLFLHNNEHDMDDYVNYKEFHKILNGFYFIETNYQQND